jgi:membrane-associated phospholipid phosphatase
MQSSPLVIGATGHNWRRPVIGAVSAGLVCALWTALVGIGWLSGPDHWVARWVASTDRGTLDRLASAGSLLFGIAGIAGLALSACVIFRLWRPWVAPTVLVLALLFSAAAERGLRAAFVQPTNPDVRTASFGRAESQSNGLATVAPRASLPQLGVPDARHSYPSGHMALAAALFVALLQPLPRHPRIPALLAIALALLVCWGGWAEVYRGSHLFSDVAGGLLLGATIAMLIIAASLRFDTLTVQRRSGR